MTMPVPTGNKPMCPLQLISNATRSLAARREDYECRSDCAWSVEVLTDQGKMRSCAIALIGGEISKGETNLHGFLSE